MKEHFYAYKIMDSASELVCTHSAFEEDKMLDLLEEIQQSHTKGLFWILKKTNEDHQKPFSLIDCKYQRVYYHYSGEVEDLDKTIKKLSKKTPD